MSSINVAVARRTCFAATVAIITIAGEYAASVSLSSLSSDASSSEKLS